MEKSQTVPLRRIYDFQEYLIDIGLAMKTLEIKEEFGELKELYRAVVFTYEQVIEEFERHFHLKVK